jgi:hypothetical protein
VLNLGEDEMSPRRELVEVLRRRVAGEEDRLFILIELEHLRSGLGDGRGEEMVRCSSARGDLIEGEGGRGVLEASFMESRFSDCERAAACELLLVLTSFVFAFAATADRLCWSIILSFHGSRIVSADRVGDEQSDAHSRRDHVDVCDLLLTVVACPLNG